MNSPYAIERPAPEEDHVPLLAELLGEIPAWHADAACRHAEDPDIFFETQSSRTRHIAMSFCDQCPVIKECGEWAKDNRQRHGIWGGKTV